MPVGLPLSPGPLCAGDLELGKLLAEGGEGRVFELLGLRGGGPVTGRGRPAGALVYKQLHRAVVPAVAVAGEWPPELARPSPEAVPAYLEQLSVRAPALAARAASASAWPLRAVLGESGEVVGVVCRRAPDRFWLAHRDGSRRLAVLSYLTSDPDRVAVAYGVDVPPPGSAKRVGLVYALARLLDAWQPSPALPDGPGPVVHGDLSAKNVLWSLRPVPEIFVLDCDGATLAAEHDARPRPATPNWDDPARPPGTTPGLSSDRYSLGIVFVRVLGAAHFPLQGRQRQGSEVVVDLELPRSWRRLADMPRLWSLCERALSVETPGERPTPAEWAYEMQELLGALGASEMAEAVRAAQGDPAPTPTPPSTSVRSVGDVTVRPVLRHRTPSTWQLVHAGPVLTVPTATGQSVGATLIVQVGAGGASGVAPRTGLFGLPPGAPPKAMVKAGWATFKATHRLVWRLLRSRGRRLHGVRRLVGVAMFDLAAACMGLFLFGMVVSPWIGL